MFKIFFISVFTVATVHAQLSIPALSPSSKFTQTVGLTDIEIQYSRPSKRNRVIFGENGIIPFGELWRTGANRATKITFSEDLKIKGTLIQKGSYAILTRPNNPNWEINFYTYESGNWSSYVDKKPIVSLTAKHQKLTDVLETFLIYIDQITLDTASLTFAWDQSKIVLPLQLGTHPKAMANIEKTLAGPSSFDYFQAALYLHETGNNLEKALTYIQKATKSENPLFFQVHREALILADLNRKTEAITAAKRSLELSKKANNKDFIRLNEKFIEKWSR
ncbi:DUF2911 domain-containing protein [Aquimarina litoralis]|uniref:DUF2911 domain-containing protein n=1 Tax=Aquimarina litoralis TaxID=584605 RepID=UPI001C561555|nr:DUF2911 domain-containing protein [Aquimarina litoralis]MBW1295205.1 DUF2911 domain-containing protein [Aquimarina litoralis]